MVKPLKSVYLKLSLVLIAGILIYIVIQFVSNKGNPHWRLDLKYSLNPSADTVDGLRIYKVRSKRHEWYALEELFKKELVFETKDKRLAGEFVSAANKMMTVGDWKDSVMDADEASKGCGRTHYKEQEFDWFYVVMFDNASMRAGYFAVLACKSRNKDYLNILIPDASGFGPVSYYNESLVSILKKTTSLETSR